MRILRGGRHTSFIAAGDEGEGVVVAGEGPVPGEGVEAGRVGLKGDPLRFLGPLLLLLGTLGWRRVGHC